MERIDQTCRPAGKIPRSLLHVLDLVGEQADLAGQRHVQKRRGVRNGLPDVLVLYRHDTSIVVIFIELKSRRGVASKAQKQVRTELLPAGAAWWMARSARAALMALHLSGVVFQAQMEAAAAQAMGRTIRRPDAAAAAGTGGGRTATRGAGAMAARAGKPWTRCREVGERRHRRIDDVIGTNNNYYLP
jgi:hypothetical protein